MPENGREKTPHIPKMAQFSKGGKNGHFAKAAAKQNGHKWSIQGLSLKILEIYTKSRHSCSATLAQLFCFKWNYAFF